MLTGPVLQAEIPRLVGLLLLAGLGIRSDGYPVPYAEPGNPLVAGSDLGTLTLAVIHAISGGAHVAERLDLWQKAAATRG